MFSQLKRQTLEKPAPVRIKQNAKHRRTTDMNFVPLHSAGVQKPAVLGKRDREERRASFSLKQPVATADLVDYLFNKTKKEQQNLKRKIVDENKPLEKVRQLARHRENMMSFLPCFV